MRELLLNILRCPLCKGSNISLETHKEDDLEIKSGRVLCKGCNISYQIEGGIVNFLNSSASKDVMNEIKAMDEDEYIKDEEGNRYRITKDIIERFKTKFLSFPEGDGSYFFRRGGSFQSIAEGSDRFYSTLDYMSLTGKENVLEIGACFSYASFKFAKKGCRVVALDISNYLKASELFIRRSYFDRVFSDMHNTPFKDNSFDIVFGSAVLHHSKDLKMAFREIYRILKPGGRLFLINESARGIFEKIHPSFEEMSKKGFSDTSYTIAEWKKGASMGGFRKIKINFLSLASDYITRHRNRGTKDNISLRLAYFFKAHKVLEGLILFLLIPARFLVRPKSWRMVCCK